MKVLLLGGTGAIGISLSKILSDYGYDVYVTSRRNISDEGSIHYIQGNATELGFISTLLNTMHFECIVDFMDYDTTVFIKNIEILLDGTEQYMYLSSSRVYAGNVSRINETSDRVLDICVDAEFLKTDEYPLHKARQEDYLRTLVNSRANTYYTIIRPYITYNTERIQLGTEEKEQWLWRALNKQPIVFSEDIAEKTSTLTYGYDVASVMARLIGNEEAYNETFHIAGANPIKWREVLEVYSDVIEEKIGSRPRVIMLNDSVKFMKALGCECQVVYDRINDRIFDNTKVDDVCGRTRHGRVKYTDPKVGLSICLKEFIEQPCWRYIDPKDQAYFDKISNNFSCLKLFDDIKDRSKYICYRLFPNITNLIKNSCERLTIRNRK